MKGAIRDGRSVLRRILLSCAALLMPLGLAWPAMAGMPAVDLQRAEQIHMARCFLCHGVEGERASALYPRLAGQHYQYIAQRLADFKSGARVSDTMDDMAAELTPDEMLALGVLFARLPAPAQAVQDAGLAEVGGGLFRRGDPSAGVAACSTCHGGNALGSARLPRLAGQPPAYLERRLRALGAAGRADDTARAHAAGLSEFELKAVTRYLSTLGD